MDSFTIALYVSEPPIQNEQVSPAAGVNSIYVGIAVAVAGVAVVVAIISISWRIRRTNKIPKTSELELQNVYLEIHELTIGEILGSGNFGSVYKGLAFGTTPVALKYLNGALEQELVAEAEILTTVHHVNVLC